MEKINKCIYTCELQNYETKERKTMPTSPAPGLVLVCNWGWAREINTFYNHFCKIIKDSFSSFVYMYPSHASHITVATLSSFKEKDAPRGMIKQGQNILSNNMSEDDKIFIESWGNEIKNNILKEGVKSFEIECIDVWFTPAAIIFIFKDESGTIEKIRNKLKESVSKSDHLKDMDEKFDGAISKYLHCPNIIHSSFSRYTKDIADKAEIDHYVNQFNNVIMKEFKPFKLNINNISLCNEYIPYMHMDREKGCVFDHPLLV